VAPGHSLAIGSRPSFSPWSLPVKQRSWYPRGKALTDTMPLTDRDAVHRLVYIEGVPPDPRPRRWGWTLLPEHRSPNRQAHHGAPLANGIRARRATCLRSVLPRAASFHHRPKQGCGLAV